MIPVQKDYKDINYLVDININYLIFGTKAWLVSVQFVRLAAFSLKLLLFIKHFPPISHFIVTNSNDFIRFRTFNSYKWYWYIFDTRQVMSLRVTQTIRASYIVLCGIMTWNVFVWMNRQVIGRTSFETCIYANKIILKLVLVTLYAMLQPFLHPLITLFRLLFSLVGFVVVAIIFFSFHFIFSLSTLSLVSPITLFELYAQERCKSRYCTKSLWREYWKEIFNTWSKYRNEAVAFLFSFLFLLLALRCKT